MDYNQFQQLNLKKGKFYTITFAKTENGLTKTTTCLVRFINYYNHSKVKAMGKVAPSTTTNKGNPNIATIIDHILTFNQSKGQYNLHCYPIANHRAHSTFKDQNGNTITRDQYEMVNPPKNSSKGDKIVFQVNLANVISIC